MFFPYQIEEEIEYEGTPLLVYTFCAVYIIAHIGFSDYIPEYFRQDIFYNFGCVPVDFKWFSPITCTFLHGGWLHLIGNLYFFWIYGRSCEKALGTLRFLSIYIIGAYVSIFIHMLTVPEFGRDVPVIGASGAISAVLGAFLVLFPTVRIRFLVFSIIYPRPLPAHGPAYFILGAWFLMQIFYGLNLTGDSTEVAFWAHIAGFAAGAFVGTIYLILHEYVMKKEEDYAKAPVLIKAWHAYLSGETENARLLLFESESDRSSKHIANWRLFSAVLSEDMDGETELSFKNLVEEFQRVRNENGYGKAFQCYCRLLSPAFQGKMTGNLHYEGASAAGRMKNYDVALYGFSMAALSNADIEMDRLLYMIAKALEKLKRKSDCVRLMAILKQKFPESNFLKY